MPARTVATQLPDVHRVDAVATDLALQHAAVVGRDVAIAGTLGGGSRGVVEQHIIAIGQLGERFARGRHTGGGRSGVNERAVHIGFGRQREAFDGKVAYGVEGDGGGVQHEAFAHRHGKGIGGQQCAVFIDGRQKNPVVGLLVSEGQCERSGAGIERGKCRLQTIAGQLRRNERALVDRHIAHDGRNRVTFGVYALNRETARGHKLPTRALRAHRIRGAGAAARTDHTGIGVRFGGNGEEGFAGERKAVIGRGGMVGSCESGTAFVHTHGESIALDFLRGGRADETAGGGVAQAEGEGTAGGVEGRSVHEFPRIVAVVELRGVGEFGRTGLVGEHRALESVDGVAQ